MRLRARHLLADGAGAQACRCRSCRSDRAADVQGAVRALRRSGTGSGDAEPPGAPNGRARALRQKCGDAGDRSGRACVAGVSSRERSMGSTGSTWSRGHRFGPHRRDWPAVGDPADLAFQPPQRRCAHADHRAAGDRRVQVRPGVRHWTQRRPESEARLPSSAALVHTVFSYDTPFADGGHLAGGARRRDPGEGPVPTAVVFPCRVASSSGVRRWFDSVASSGPGFTYCPRTTGTRTTPTHLELSTAWM